MKYYKFRTLFHTKRNAIMFDYIASVFILSILLTRPLDMTYTLLGIMIYLICAMLILTLHAFLGKKYYGLIYAVIAVEDLCLVFCDVNNVYAKVIAVIFFIFEIIYFYLQNPNKQH